MNNDNRETLHYAIDYVEQCENKMCSKYYAQRYSSRFLQDMSMTLSICLAKGGNYNHFFYLTPENLKLKKLLNHRKQDFLSYSFDELLTDNIISLMTMGKSYVLVNLGFDNKEELQEICFQDINFSYAFSLCNDVYFIAKKCHGGYKVFKIPKKNLIELDLLDLNISREFFKNILNNLYKDSLNDTANLNLNNALNNKFGELKRQSEIKLINDTGKSYWGIMGFCNDHFSDVYLVYRAYKLYDLKKQMLKYLLSKYNDMLQRLGDKYEFQGKIENGPLIDVSDEDLQKLFSGLINCKQFIDMLTWQT